MRQPLCLVSTCCNSSCCFRPKDWSKRREAAPLRQEQGGGTRGGVMERLATPLVAATAILALSAPPVAYGQSISNGAALFQKACIGCHDMGGNLLQPGATLFKKDLQRNGVATEEGIYDITYYGKGRMPGFGERCTPRGQCTFGPRLQEDEIKLLAEFVKAQADRGWPKIESYGD
ncbi:unnamed protein product [Musa hybrid cultivar]